MIRFKLPLPPPLNNIFINLRGGGRAKSKRYEAWIKTAGWELVTQKPDKVSGAYRLFISVPSNAIADIDNYIKPLSDLLQTHGIITNDKFAKRIEIDRDEAVPEGVVWVGLEACDERTDSEG